MGIPNEDVAQVRAATDITVLIGEYTPLKRVGRRYVGLCPFHAEKTGSFSVNQEEGLYYCFGCQASGDAITFLRAIEGCDFVEAVERLGARVGITVRNEEGGRGREERQLGDKLKEAMRRAVDFYHDRLLTAPDAAPARQYLRSRGYDSEVVRKFLLGWSPNAGTELSRALGIPADVLRAAGLTSDTGRGTQDAFRGRVMFPILDPSGTPVALGGRVLPGSPGEGSGPKYRNSRESPIYSKRRTLYGLNWARQGVVQASEMVVCEGYTDVIGMFVAGVPRAVATCGTSLTDEHFQMIARFAKRVVLAFDADSAGQAAASRFYQWEKDHDIEVAVAALPPGGDPGDLAQSDPAALKTAVDRARPFLAFRVERALASSDLRSNEGRARAAADAGAMVAEHPNELVRDQYLVAIADRTMLDVDRVRAIMARGQSKAGRNGYPPEVPPERHASLAPRQGSSRDADGRQGSVAGRDALALAIHDPASMAGRLDECLFPQPLHRAAFRALVAATSLHEAIDGAEPPVADLIRQLTVIEPEADADGTVVRLVHSAGQRALTRAQAVSRASRETGDAEAQGEAATDAAFLISQLQITRDPGVTTPPPPVVEAADLLLGWLRSHPWESG